MKVYTLNDLIGHGYTTGFKANVELETHISDKKKLLYMGFALLKTKSFYVLHNGTFRCKLYGNDFSLGNMTVLMGPYTTKGSKIIPKALTYIEGDKREIKLKLCNNSICYLITEEKKEEIIKMIEGIGKYVYVDNMNCKWDFIYEVHE